MGRVVSKQNIFQRFLNGVIGIFAGIVLILSMFVLAIVSETKENPAKVAKNATEISIQDVASNKGNFVTFSGQIKSLGNIDDIALSDTVDFVSLISHTEVYAWVQHSEESTETSLGGTQTTVTVYTYSKDWTTSIVVDFSNDTTSDPAKLTAQTENTAIKTRFSSVSLGTSTRSNDNVTMGEVKIKSDLRYDNYIELTQSDLTGKLKSDFNVSGSYAYNLDSTLRISYKAVKTGISGTAAGLLKNDGTALTLTKYYSKKGTEIYMFAANVSSKTELVNYLDAQHKGSLWMTRILVVTMMAVGFALIAKPISVVLSVIPFLGKLSNAVLGVAAAILGFIVGVIAILIGITFKYWFITLPVIAIVVVLLVVYAKKKKQENQDRNNQNNQRNRQYRR